MDLAPRRASVVIVPKFRCEKGVTETRAKLMVESLQEHSREKVPELA